MNSADKVFAHISWHGTVSSWELGSRHELLGEGIVGVALETGGVLACGTLSLLTHVAHGQVALDTGSDGLLEEESILTLFAGHVVFALF